MLDKILVILTNKCAIVILIALIGISSVFFFGDDNPIEEISEEIIKDETGIDIDLTPHSRESIINNETG